MNSERYYTTLEVASILNVSHDTVTRYFLNEPGVLKLTRSSRYRRQRVHLRIPESTLQHFIRRHTNGPV